MIKSMKKEFFKVFLKAIGMTLDKAVTDDTICLDIDNITGLIIIRKDFDMFKTVSRINLDHQQVVLLKTFLFAFEESYADNHDKILEVFKLGLETKTWIRS